MEDREWLVGVAAARRTQIPVHAVGLGDPERESPVTVRGRLLEFAEPGGLPDAVQTRLHEEVLTAISAQTGGQYLPSRQGPVLAGDFFRDAVEGDGSRELSEDAAPQPRDRSAGFVAAGLLCLLAATLRGR